MIEKNIYDNAYGAFTPDFINKENLSKINSFLDENTESLRDFIDKFMEQFDYQYNWENMSVLEVGCGIGSLTNYVNHRFNDYLGIDFSSLAIANAKSISELKGSHNQFKVFDITSCESLEQEFDFIIDSHLLHCLKSKEARSNYFTFVKKHLKKNGVFLAETMAFHGGIEFPFEYEYKEDFTLWKNYGDSNESFCLRSILPSLNLEAELQESGLKIKTYFFHNELSFNLFPEYSSYPEDKLPKVIRFSLEQI